MTKEKFLNQYAYRFDPKVFERDLDAYVYSVVEHLRTNRSWEPCCKCNSSGRAMNYNNPIPTTLDVCDVCNGERIISTLTGRPPL